MHRCIFEPFSRNKKGNIFFHLVEQPELVATVVSKLVLFTFSVVTVTLILFEWHPLRETFLYSYPILSGLLSSTFA